MHSTDAALPGDASDHPNEVGLEADAAGEPELTDSDVWSAKRYGYRVGSFGFLVGEETRSEVVRAPVISALPHSPDWLLGLMNLRGNLVPVADLHALCGEPAERRTHATVLVLDAGDKAVGIPIDGLPLALTGLEALPDTPPLPAPLAGHAGPAFDSDGSTWLAFDHDQFFRALARGPDTHS